MTLKKTNSRIAAVKLCYQQQRIGHSNLGEIILIQKTTKNFSLEEQKYTQEMIAFQQKNQNRIDKLIQKHLKNWKQNRLQSFL